MCTCVQNAAGTFCIIAFTHAVRNIVFIQFLLHSENYPILSESRADLDFLSFSVEKK